MRKKTRRDIITASVILVVLVVGMIVISQFV